MLSQATDTGRLDGKVDGAKLVRLCAVHGVVEPVLTEADIINKHCAVIDRIARAVMELNGIATGATLTASGTFRPESGPPVPVPAGEGSGEGASGAAA